METLCLPSTQFSTSPAAESSVSSVSAAPVLLLTALRDGFETIPAPRVDRTKLHRLSDILLLALAAVCCGAEGFEDIETWAKLQGADDLRRDFGLSLDNGIPHHDTFRRLFARLRPETLEQSLHLVRKHLYPDSETLGETPKHIAVDGKELRGSHDAFRDCPAVILLSAFASDNRLVLGQKKVDVKSNEIPAAVEVLNEIAIAGATITADALHCQRETAKVIREREADYILAVKDNQETLHRALIHVFETNRQEKRLPMQVAQTVDKDHGRIEVRKGYLIHIDDWLPEDDPLRKLWPGLTCVLCVVSERVWTHRGQKKTSYFTRYFISSSTTDVHKHMEFVRSHWRIENSLHWLMDVTFGEDASRVRIGHEAQNLATLRRVVATLLRQSAKGTPTKSIRGRKKSAGWSRAYLLKTLTI